MGTKCVIMKNFHLCLTLNDIDIDYYSMFSLFHHLKKSSDRNSIHFPFSLFETSNPISFLTDFRLGRKEKVEREKVREGKGKRGKK